MFSFLFHLNLCLLSLQLLLKLVLYLLEEELLTHFKFFLHPLLECCLKRRGLSVYFSPIFNALHQLTFLAAHGRLSGWVFFGMH